MRGATVRAFFCQERELVDAGLENAEIVGAARVRRQ